MTSLADYDQLFAVLQDCVSAFSCARCMAYLKLYLTSCDCACRSLAKLLIPFRRFLLEWLSYLSRYIPVGLLEVVPQHIRWRAPFFAGRNELETLMGSQNPADWVKISEMFLGPTPAGFSFKPKHKSNAYSSSEQGMSLYQENG